MEDRLRGQFPQQLPRSRHHSLKKGLLKVLNRDTGVSINGAAVGTCSCQATQFQKMGTHLRREWLEKSEENSSSVIKLVSGDTVLVAGTALA